jgi:hypothetical protein
MIAVLSLVALAGSRPDARPIAWSADRLPYPRSIALLPSNTKTMPFVPAAPLRPVNPLLSAGLIVFEMVGKMPQGDAGVRGEWTPDDFTRCMERFL